MGLFSRLFKLFASDKDMPSAESDKKKDSTSRQERTSKEKGDAFENYVICKFDRKFFALKDMRSDKGVRGFYPESNKYPDLVLEYKPASVSFAVECKWRCGWWKRNDGKESIDWAGGDKKNTELQRIFQEKQHICLCGDRSGRGT